MKKTDAIEKAKEFRGRADALLQGMKAHRADIGAALASPEKSEMIDIGEVIAQHTLSIRDLESCIMRQGMALKYIGNPEPYPASKLTVEDIAKDMYTKYCEASGYISAPAWDVFASYPTNAKQVQGWLSAAAAHPALHRVEPTSGGLKM